MSGALLDAVPEAVIAAFAADPALPAKVVGEVARRTGDGHLARAGAIRGKPAGRRASGDAALLRNFEQLIIDRHTQSAAGPRACGQGPRGAVSLGAKRSTAGPAVNDRGPLSGAFHLLG
jgi:hypothetical protein